MIRLQLCKYLAASALIGATSACQAAIVYDDFADLTLDSNSQSHDYISLNLEALEDYDVRAYGLIIDWDVVFEMLDSTKWRVWDHV